MKKVILFMVGVLASLMLSAQSRWSVTPEAGLVVNKENEGTSVTLGFKAGAGVLYQLKEKYPEIYHQVEVRLETGWETTIALLEQGMQEGVIRPVRIPILKMMLEASLEQFFQRDILLQNEITYAQALQEVVGILMYGIASEGENERGA